MQRPIGVYCSAAVQYGTLHSTEMVARSVTGFGEEDGEPSCRAYTGLAPEAAPPQEASHSP